MSFFCKDFSVVCGVDRHASGANFTAYQELKKFAHRKQPELTELPSWQTMFIGLISGAMGPFSNAPIDTIKTRELFVHPCSSRFVIINHSQFAGLQKATYAPGTSSLSKIVDIAREMFRQEGVHAFYKGITPRVLRVAPGQAVVFPVYEKVRMLIEQIQAIDVDDSYSE